MAHEWLTSVTHEYDPDDDGHDDDHVGGHDDDHDDDHDYHDNGVATTGDNVCEENRDEEIVAMSKNI